MTRALIVLHDGYTDSEATYAYDRCLEEDFDVRVATPTGSDPVGEKGWDRIKADCSTDFAVELFDILIIPGGVKSIEKVRQDKFTLELVRRHHEQGKVIATMCHGAQLLIEADLCEDRLISGYYSIKKDIENAGGTYADFVAVCDRIVTAPHYKYNGKWMQAVLTTWKSLNK